MIDLTGWASLLRFVRGRRSRPAPSDEGGVLLGIRDDGTQVYLPPFTAEHASGILCLGVSGTGKTVAIAFALIQELAGDG